MSRRKQWEIGDGLWSVVGPLPPKMSGAAPGHKRIDDRKTLQGVLFVLYEAAGVWEELQQVLLDRLRAADQVDLSRATVDASQIQAKRGRSSPKVGPNPVDRGRPGSERHVLTDANGTPLRVSPTGENRNDVTQLLLLVAGRTAPALDAPDGWQSRHRPHARPTPLTYPLGNTRRHPRRLPPAHTPHEPRPQNPSIPENVLPAAHHVRPHTHASIMFGGESVVTLARWLGHPHRRSPSVTMFTSCRKPAARGAARWTVCWGAGRPARRPILPRFSPAPLTGDSCLYAPEKYSVDCKAEEMGGLGKCWKKS